MSVSGDVQLTPKIVEKTEFTVVGISIRTSNAKEMSGNGVIAQQWDRFMKEGLLGKIPNKVDPNILAVYIDYESGANGAYTFMIGARVSSAEDVPLGMVARKVPAGRYAVFISGERIRREGCSSGLEPHLGNTEVLTRRKQGLPSRF